MKKIILLFVLPLTALVATIDFTMIRGNPLIKDGDSLPISPGSTELSTDNPYLESVKLPKCDGDNPEVQFIRSNSDWSTINSSKRIFCVSPGDYTSLNNIKITASGTAKKRRYIILNNGNDLHPGKLNKNNLANFALDLNGASYWIFDRIASFDVGFSHSFILRSGSTHNIFNRMFTQNLYHTMWIKNKAHFNTVQNSRFDGITKKGAEADLATINILHFGDSAEIFGTKVVNNEFVNVKAFRLAKSPLSDGTRQAVNYEGTIFDNNTIEFDNTIRTDCNGNYTPDGQCMGMEAMALGTKGGSNDPTKPYIVSNNKIWGGLPSDPTFKNLSSKGGFINAYMGTKNIHILNNVVFNTTRGIQVADRYDASRGTYDAVIKNNIIVACGARSRAKNEFALSLSQAEGMLVENNLIKDPIGAWGRVIGNRYNNTVQNNDIINSDSPLVYEGNWEQVKGIDTNIVYSTAQEAGYSEDYEFTADKFTNKPREMILENVLKK